MLLTLNANPRRWLAGRKIRAELAEGYDRIHWIDEQVDRLDLQAAALSDALTEIDRLKAQQNPDLLDEIDRLKAQLDHQIDSRERAIEIAVRLEEENAHLRGEVTS